MILIKLFHLLHYYLFLQWIKEEKDMAVIYATLIIKGLRTFASVPDRIKPQVKEVLEALEVPELAEE